MSNLEAVWPEFDIQFDGRFHTIRADLELMYRFQKETGKNPWAERAFENVSPIDTAALIWAGLVKKNKTLTVQQVAARCEPKDLRTAGKILVEYFKRVAAEFSSEEPEAEQKNPETEQSQK